VGGTYEVGQIVSASYSCTDALSGVIRCGAKAYTSGPTGNTGKLTSPVDTSSLGTKTFIVQAVDAAGNQASASVMYTVTAAPVNLVVACRSAALSYGQDYICGVYASSNAGLPQGVVNYKYDNGAVQTIALASGVAELTLPKPAVGQHSVVVSYSAQGIDAAASQQTEMFTVSLAPVAVSLKPSTTFFTGGVDLWLTGAVQSVSAGPPDGTGSFTFTDGGKVLAVMPVDSTGRAVLAIPISQLTNGSHSYAVAYAGGVNYATGNASVSVTIAKP
jgi:hypothetical protein